MNNKHWTIVICLLLAMSALSGCARRADKPLIVTSIYPLTDIVRQIVNDKTDVVQLVPEGAEPHEWEPLPDTLASLDDARLFVAIGAGLEPLAKLNCAPDKTLLLSDNAQLIYTNGSANMHLWLDPKRVEKFVVILTERICAIDTTNADFYRNNSKKYLERLHALDEEYIKRLAQCPRREFVTIHAAFAYLAASYGLTEHALLGNSPDEEPSARDMAEFAQYIKQHTVRVVYYEPQESEKIARSIAAECGVRVLPLNPLEMAPLAGSNCTGYIDIMRANLDNLCSGLQ